MFGEPGDCYGSIYSIRARIGIANNTHFFNDCIHFIRFSLSLPYLPQCVCVYLCVFTFVCASEWQTHIFVFIFTRSLATVPVPLSLFNIADTPSTASKDPATFLAAAT